LLAGGQLTGKQISDLEIVERNAATLLKHVNNLLDIARLEASQMELNYAQVDLARLLHLCAAHFEVLAQERRFTLSLETPPSLSMQADPEKLQRIFLNLLSNAFKFTPDGGSLRCAMHQEDEWVTITIQDNGPGIRPEVRQSIFERFSQGENDIARRFGGTRLGLVIVKEFVELHGGTVTASDAPGGGALFTVVLPLAAPSHVVQIDVPSTPVETEVSAEIAFQTLAELSPWSQHDEEAPFTASTETYRPLVLIIEDNQEMTRFVASTLASDYRTAAAFEGLEGLEKALALQPDLLVCDIMMPNMSGDQFIAKARTYPELDPVPIIMLSARSDDSLRIQLLREGAQDYLVKPFFPDELRVRVANLIKMKQARQILQHELANQNQDIVALANEVTLRKRETQQALEELRQSEERKDIFLSMASHELKTPITSLKIYTQILHKMFAHEERDQVVKYFSRMETQVNKLISLIDNLLDISKIQVGKLALVEEEFDIDTFIHELVDTIQQTSTKHTIRLSGTVHATLLGDQDRLGQVLFNLLTNAYKYSPAADVVDVMVVADDEQATISVRDYGVGIPQKHLTSIFERFYRVYDDNDKKFPGLGLGLYIASQIVKRHGGKIWVESIEGQGSTFSFSVPLRRRSEDPRLLQGAGQI
jgi:signal transduction histidine kinase